MPSHPARFRPWLAVLAGTLAAVLLVEALRPKAPVQAQAPASLPAPARADVQASPFATPERVVVASRAVASAPAPVAKRIAKADGRTRSRHARIRRQAMDVVAAGQSPAPAVPSKDTAALPHLDSLVASHSDSCLDGIAFVPSDSVAAPTALPSDSLTAPAAAQALRPNVPELAATAPRPCLQLPKELEALKPEAPQAILLPISPEKSLQ